MGLLGKGTPSDGLSDNDRAAKMIQRVMQGSSPVIAESKSIKKKKKPSTKSLKLDDIDLLAFNKGSKYVRSARNRPGTSCHEWEVFPPDDLAPGPQTLQQKIQYLISKCMMTC